MPDRAAGTCERLALPGRRRRVPADREVAGPDRHPGRRVGAQGHGRDLPGALSRRPRQPERRRTCTRWCCCDTARATGTGRTASPAGPTSICRTRAGEEAKAAGQLLKQEGFAFDQAFTSVLKRAIRTLVARPRRDGPAVAAGRALLAPQRAPLRGAAGPEQGRDRRQVRRGPGQDLAAQLRHPAAAARRRATRASPATIRRYQDLAPADLPLTECLKDTVARFLPYWHERIAPAVKSGKRVIIAAHGNSLRALVKYLDDISDAGHRRAEHPHRHPAGLRAGRQPAPAQALLPGRSRRRRSRHQGRRLPGQGQVGPAVQALEAEATGSAAGARRTGQAGAARRGSGRPGRRWLGGRGQLEHQRRHREGAGHGDPRWDQSRARFPWARIAAQPGGPEFGVPVAQRSSGPPPLLGTSWALNSRYFWVSSTLKLRPPINPRPAAPAATPNARRRQRGRAVALQLSLGWRGEGREHGAVGLAGLTGSLAADFAADFAADLAGAVGAAGLGAGSRRYADKQGGHGQNCQTRFSPHHDRGFARGWGKLLVRGVCRALSL